MIIESEKEQEWLHTVASTSWLSLTDYDGDNKYEWELADGTSVDLGTGYSNWREDEPNYAKMQCASTNTYGNTCNMIIVTIFHKMNAKL